MKVKTSHIALTEKTTTFLTSTKKMLVNNQWIESEAKKTFDTLNPANGNVLTKIPIADENDVDNAVVIARNAFDLIWKDGIKPAERSDLLWKLATLIERDIKIFMELETLDNGKPLEKAKYDVLGAINHLKYYAGWATKIEGTTIPTHSNKLVYTKKEPLGVVGLIVPWNFPLMIAIWKLAPALACGNCCILKPAEQTPLTALYLGKLILEAGFPPGVVNIITGPGIPTGQAMSQHMDIDKISFTGSTLVGKKIMEASAKSNLKKVSLELGGKSPNVIFEDADLDMVLDSLQWSSFYNTGQECTLGSRIYVQESIFEKVLKSFKEKAGKMTISNGFNNPDLGPMISEKQLNTVLDYIELGETEGAKLVYGGNRLDGDLAKGYFLEPTIFITKNEDLTIAREEIFGPVVVVSKFKDFDEVIKKANTSKYGLAAAVWTKDLSKAHRFANAIDAGTVWINGYDLFDAAVPFGGFKQSGNGKEMGKSAIDLYTKEKAVWTVL
ncbi:Phenylacetaldehyde dehydrogenase [Flagellimonas maritima]|uniref:Phenylacetaldehyde dehydrogenase n=1 Tax=Flagellimonas maritima TaxID=1383885 RepID=A0A2Z4LUY8_9FLAO|nr:aldehyde dehydrogenase family protein [Allomuricauda aurantiaca]AWX45553.1 Phenylacetaldehyde dehydrogenase [Allomuricauda aurantiaca]